MQKLGIIVMAAGKGSRLGSRLPKALVRISGMPMLGWLLTTILRAGLPAPIVIVGHKKQKIIAYLKKAFPSRFIAAEQHVLDGTGGAVRVALPRLPSSAAVIVTLCADNPFLSAQTISTLARALRRAHAVVAVATTRRRTSDARGILLRDWRGRITGITGADEARNTRGEYTLGIMAFDGHWLRSRIGTVKKNAKGEYPLHDLVATALRERNRVASLLVSRRRELVSVNTQDELRLAKRIAKLTKS